MRVNIYKREEVENTKERRRIALQLQERLKNHYSNWQGAPQWEPKSDQWEASLNQTETQIYSFACMFVKSIYESDNVISNDRYFSMRFFTALGLIIGNSFLKTDANDENPFRIAIKVS